MTIPEEPAVTDLPSLASEVLRLGWMAGWAENKWQPIETAPKDGTRVLLYGPEESGGRYVAVSYFYIGRWAVELFYDCEAPTHWQPLPQPPTGETE